MQTHALQTGRVPVKRAQLVGQGHGLKRRLAPLVDNVWSDWLPTYAFAVEHRCRHMGAVTLGRHPHFNDFFAFRGKRVLIA